MKRFALASVGFLVLSLLTLFDVIGKFLLGVLFVLFLWLPFGLFAGFSIRPWYWVGCDLGVVLLGFWDCCDIFGLDGFAEWAHRQISGRSHR
jgi:hypothetical protein